MTTLRDFGDGMYFDSKSSNINAYGQSSHASKAKADVPPYVKVGPEPMVTGMPVDALSITEDYQEREAAAANAEKRAQEVMQNYTDTTTRWLSSMPELAPAPQVVMDAAPADASMPKPGGSGPGDSGDTGFPAPRGSEPAPGPSTVDGPPAGAPAPGSTPSSVPPVSSPPGATNTSAVHQPFNPPTTAPGLTGDTTRAPAGPAAPVGGFGIGGGTAGPRGGEPGGRGGQPVPRGGEPGGRGVQPGARGAAPIEAAAKGGGRTTSGIAPMGAAGAGRREEDEEHKVKYAMPSSDFFEPETEDGYLRDPFRAGSFVAPTAIGDDDEDD